MMLFTFQAKKHDITITHDPISEYTDQKGMFYDMAKYLGWDNWIWTLPDIRDFENRWFKPLDEWREDLWFLDVPADKIKWCAMDLQCESRRPIDEWFFPNMESIRKLGDIPQGLVKTPVKKEWVLKRCAKVIRIHDLPLKGSGA